MTQRQDRVQNSAERDELTSLLQAAATGEPRAADQLLPLVYRQLHALARKCMSAERRDHTLQATALVNEVYVRLVRDEAVNWKGRGHFYLAAADAMRRILIDHARKHGAAKRGGDWERISLRLDALAVGKNMGELLSLDEALASLEIHDAQAAAVVRLRFFAGLNIKDTAKALEISPRSVDRNWAYARVWLRRALNSQDSDTSNKNLENR